MSEATILQQLLDALDAGDPALWSKVAARPREGHFFGPLARHELDDLDVVLLLVALARRLQGHATVSGRSLVTGAGATSARRLAAVGRLAAEGPLVAAGLLLPETPRAGPVEAHETAWRLGDAVFARAGEVFARPGPAADDAQHPPPYRNNSEFLADLRRLSLVYRRRAARIFRLDPWTSTGLTAGDGAEELVERARSETARVAARIAATSDRARVPLLAMRDEHGLDLDSLVILVTVLFQELVEGVGAVDAVDLVKLVSVDEGEVLRRRKLLRPLQNKGLLRLEGAYGGKELTADAMLPNEVVARMLGEEAAIDSDARIDFHAYLQRLQSSDPFFTDLEGGAA